MLWQNVQCCQMNVLHVNSAVCYTKEYSCKYYHMLWQIVNVTCFLCSQLQLWIFMSISTFIILWQIVQCCKVFPLQSATLMHTHVKSHQLHVAKKSSMLKGRRVTWFPCIMFHRNRENCMGGRDRQWTHPCLKKWLTFGKYLQKVYDHK